MYTYLLVHGGYHGTWCWKEVIKELKLKGHRAIATDLSGHGNDITNRNIHK